MTFKKGHLTSEETRRKISLSLIGNKRNFGKKCKRNYGNYYFSEKTREKIRQKRKNQIITEEQKRKTSNSLKEGFKVGKIKSWNKGLTKETDRRIKALTSEAKAKLTELRKTRIFPLKDTKIEVKIQNFLKQLNIDFFTHKYIKEIEHGYQCDILVLSLNIIIECDGNYWHKYPIGKDIDHIRTKELLEKGFKVLRLWESEINDMTINKFEERVKHETINPS